MNIISCDVFVNEKKSTLILSCCRKLVDYYISKGFGFLGNNSNALSDVPLRVKQRINAEVLYKNDLVMACYRATSFCGKYVENHNNLLWFVQIPCINLLQ